MNAKNIIKPNGILICVSFHSLEDRIVKNFMRDYATTVITKKPIIPSQAEIKANNKSRSAKMRVCVF